MSDPAGGGGRAIPTLSIVVGARSSEHPADACLDALSDQLRDGVEVILVEDEDSGAARRYEVRHVLRPRGLVPELWAEGIRHASGELVGLLPSTAAPDADWVDRTLELHAGGAAGVGGAVEPGGDLGVADWAVYFLRYSPYMLPVAPDEVLEIPGDNASYRADVLARYRHVYEEAFWEPAVHRVMRADGHQLRFSPLRVVRQLPGANIAAFCRQRFTHGRAHGRQRSAGLGRAQILGASLTAPLVPPLITLRAARAVLAKRRNGARFLVAAPLILYFSCWWATGELVGRLEVASGRRP